MADVVNTGTAPDTGNGDPLRTAFVAINARFQQLLGTLSARGDWAPATVYAATPAREWVINAGQAYVAAVNHTSGATFAADLGTGKWMAVDVAQLILDLAASAGSSLVGFLQAGTGATPRTVQDKARETATPEDFAAAGDGVADDTAELQAAVTASVGKRLRLAKVYKISSQINLPNDIEIVFVKGAKVTTATPNINLFYGVSKVGIVVRRGLFEQTVGGASSYVAGIHLENCNYCDIEKNTFTGMQWCGIYLNGNAAGSNHNDITANRFTGFLGSVADSADIHVYYNSSYNSISKNRCYGGGSFGINIQDPGGLGTYLPQRNKVHNNYIGAHTFFGINVYIGGTGPSYTSVTQNLVEDISGAANPSSGTGIYVVGTGVGGTNVSGNNVRNCCTATLNRTNAPAGIGVSGTISGNLGVTVMDNTIDGMTQGDGVLIASCSGQTSVSGNTVRMPASNNGAGVGGAQMQGNALRVINCDNVNINGGEYHNNGTADAVLIYAASADMNNIKVTGVGAKSADGVPIRITRLSSFVLTGVTVTGNTGVTASNGPQGMELSGITEGLIQGNRISTGAQAAAYIADCTNIRLSNNSFNSTGAAGVLTTGVCTGSYYDKSNRHSGHISNGATGIKCEQLRAAAPTTGTAAVGDRVEALAPGVGTPKGWISTTAASPGTWVSEGNL